jgi:hypothetical protein
VRQARQLAADHDPLARRQGGRETGSGSQAALDAPSARGDKLGSDFGAEMDAGIVGE